jgi:hypothetical protein
MQALGLAEGVILTFTKVIDELELGGDDSTTIIRGTTTRADYEASVPKHVLEIVDSLFEILKGYDPEYELNYTKYYIGLARSGVVNNFLSFRPKQNFLKLTFKCAQATDFEKNLENSGVDLIGYDPKWHEYTIRITPKDFQQHKQLLTNIIKKAFDYNNEE